MYRTLLAVGVGSFLGGIARYGVQFYFQRSFPSSFPLGTLVVNVAGCFIIGIIYALSVKENLLSPQWRIFLATGFCGGFTTFSTFAYENIFLLSEREYLSTALYIGLSVLLGLLAAYAGALLVRLWI